MARVTAQIAGFCADPVYLKLNGFALTERHFKTDQSVERSMVGSISPFCIRKAEPSNRNKVKPNNTRTHNRNEF